jgi:magnesium chelatase family protein
VQRYRGRISGPLLDRVDLVVECRAPVAEELLGPPGESSAAVRARVLEVRQPAWQRQGCVNARLEGGALDRHCVLGAAQRALLARSAEHLGLSARAQTRVRRVARTIADAAWADDRSQTPGGGAGVPRDAGVKDRYCQNLPNIAKAASFRGWAP